ncbi:lipid-A-disaccharide synthase N-terminal domain-containing protein [Arenibaculum pallidiluteum]|uniref:lipid-A-disaccharide synthase N-terminal domain-containing protein n=1 Tax=Arenibaculum pallidiluteum TaxID=2812559 RepID=UPI001A978259|nr:lipid-A-disaccharide synthase N-terminal domain-containing protein [Arenibaculum pallidiluteum]
MNLDLWVAIGMLGQGMFSMRFIYQWIYSERVKRSVIPEVFWYFSLAGGVILLAYAIRQRDPVFILGQGAGLLIYLRNIWMIWREKRGAAPHAGSAGVAPQ